MAVFFLNAAQWPVRRYMYVDSIPTWIVMEWSCQNEGRV